MDTIRDNLVDTSVYSILVSTLKKDEIQAEVDNLVDTSVYSIRVSTLKKMKYRVRLIFVLI